jgi:hypothetical protein
MKESEKDYTKHTVTDLRKELVTLGYQPEEADSIKGKTNLINAIQEHKSEDVQSFNNYSIELENGVEKKEEEEEDNTPSRFSIEWSDYVMSLFDESELVDGNPNIIGLRRIAHLLIGPIVKSVPKDAQMTVTPNSRLGFTGVCSWEITISPWDSNKDITYGGSADAGSHNVDDKFALYPVAMAEVRAEARALKRVLGINSVSEEELSNKTLDDLPTLKFGDYNGEEDNINKKISETQIKIIKKIADKMNINVEKFINMGKNDYKDIKEIAHETAIKMVGDLNKWQNATDPQVPVEILN